MEEEDSQLKQLELEDRNLSDFIEDKQDLIRELQRAKEQEERLLRQIEGMEDEIREVQKRKDKLIAEAESKTSDKVKAVEKKLASLNERY